MMNIALDYCDKNTIGRCYLEATHINLTNYYAKFGFYLINNVQNNIQNNNDRLMNENLSNFRFLDESSGDGEYPMEIILFEKK